MRKACLLVVLTSVLIACRDRFDPVTNFEEYYELVHDKGQGQWDYTSDTLLVWFEDKTGEPGKRYQGQKRGGAWKEWDDEMKSRSYIDSLWYNTTENAIQGYFFETNDFYELIGKGPTKTLRTYWLNDADKISELLIFWIPEENTHTSEHLVGFYEWSMAEDSAVTMKIYPNREIVPSKENAVLWKKMLSKWNAARDGL